MSGKRIKKWGIPLKISFEGFPKIFEKTGNATKILFWGGFRFFLGPKHLTIQIFDRRDTGHLNETFDRCDI